MEKHEFQAQARQVLDLMINSVYSNPDIFIRELISNASDAIDKRRIEALENGKTPEEGRITLVINKEAKTLSFIDNGIGMDKDDLVAFLGTIANSGTKEFAKAMSEAKGDAKTAENLIGQFGVGFYSAFIAAEEVVVETKKEGCPAYIWTSRGDGDYEIDETSREMIGSTITLHLKDKKGEGKDYLDKWDVRSIIKEYSDFVTYPIFLEAEGEKKDEKEEPKPVNSMQAIWKRPAKEVKDEEYKEFYHHLCHDWDEPLDWLHYKAEGSNEFSALLYIPKHPPMDLFYPDSKHGIDLFIKRVFIMKDCKDLIPSYLRFVKGVVDSEDLPLNVSREILQQDTRTAAIKKSVVKKILDRLSKLQKKEAEKYAEFWRTFGMVLKEGLMQDSSNQESILKLCVFETSKGEKTSIEDYVLHMEPGQEKIYYLASTAGDAVINSPKLESFKKRNLTVLLLKDPIDEIWVHNVPKFDKYDFVSVSSEEAEKEAGEEVKDEGQYKDFTDEIKKSLGNLVEEVKISHRLVDSPVCFTQKGEEISPQMRNLFKSMGQPVPEEKRVLEVNPANPLIKKMMEDKDSIADYSTVLYALAQAADGESIKDASDFTAKLTALLTK
ncbi:MAG: molecular chaperone HtpG [Synergistaceae bacterium]|nr:molecular chaperone HtpG [Synergistaceae bacterium]